MDETLPDDQAITVPVPSVEITVEDQFKALLLKDITHFVFFVRKIISKAFYGSEQQIEWLNAVRWDLDRTEDFSKNTRIRVVEVDFPKPRPGAALELFWKPARGIIFQKVQEYTWICFSMAYYFGLPLLR
ncbi:hypothetical protein N7447_006935 [Penicillium robsamsonii]|uniref:uncharacterized protein n=1 Tax=Penicillium robsamsonii TaxID=1792511 RepID=UPI0025470B43|nr:uncharacterized protein N7447_006935 [Penicillium robsamsonii]KAJ5824595.1 hypothetical protein N7447_006935 [Penicillium robsamsonii]